MKYRLIPLSFILLILLTANATNAFAFSAPAVNDLSISIDTVIASGFDRPVQVTHAGDGSGRLFVVEQTGRIKIIQPNHQVTTFLNLAARVVCCGERGLLGVAFHPQYTDNGFFYVNYTDTAGDTTVSRFQVSADADVADANSEEVLFKIDQPYTNHNGGQVLFGPDGYLYIGTGDGGSGGDPQNNAQSLSTVLGKILRIDVDQGNPYAVPPDNPFVGTAGADARIWAWGLRNPWRFSFDRLTGDMYIGDVGQNQWEEIDFQPASSSGGENYGWRCLEGTHTYSTSPPCNSLPYLDALVGPIAEYDHSEGRSITGGFVYRGSLYPSLYGAYFFSDYVNGKIFSLQRDGETWVRTQELDTGRLISAFGEDEAGELYVVDYGGSIRQITDPSMPQPNLNLVSFHVDRPQANPGETLTYTIELQNTGLAYSQTFTMSNLLPAKITYLAGTFSASSGVADDSDPAQLVWMGSIGSQTTISMTYQAVITPDASGSIVNLMTLTAEGLLPIQRYALTSTPRPLLATTIDDFFLPGTQPGLHTGLVDSVDCQTCHSPAIYDRWRGSAMGQAGRDPVTWAAIYNANAFAPNAGEFCLRCHTATGWFNGRSAPSDGSSLLPQDIRNGISCQLCHRMVDVIPSTTDEAAAIDAQIRGALLDLPPIDHRSSAMIILDPEDRRRGPFDLPDGFSYHSAYQTDLLGQAQDAWKESSLCGSCHNIDNPVLSWDEGMNQYWPNTSGTPAPDVSNGSLFPIERTFDEWAASDYASTGVFAPQFSGEKPDRTVRSCQDCHMPRQTGTAAQDDFLPLFRDCETSGCLPEHGFYGANTWLPVILQDPTWRVSAESDAAYLEHTRQTTIQFLKKAATLSMTMQNQGNSKMAQVTVFNQTGHKLPTGYPEGRRMWLNLQAFDQNGVLVYESGRYDWQTHELIFDADIKVYEAVQGLTPELAALLQLPPGESFHFVLNNTTIKDNRIPPRGVTQAEYNRPGLVPVGAVYADNQYWDQTIYALPPETDSVIVRLYYQVMTKEYLEFLENYGGYDGMLLQTLWQNNPPDPVLMGTVFFPSYQYLLPLVLQ